MFNLLNSTEIATFFPDGALHTRRFTTQTTKLINMIPSNVGRPINDVTSDLIYTAMGADITDMLRTLVFVRKAHHYVRRALVYRADHAELWIIGLKA